MKKLSQILMLTLFIPCTVFCNILFVLYDSGETIALTPVINKLKERGEKVDVIKLNPSSLNRYELLSDERVLSYDPEVLVTGDASSAQLQFLKAFRGKAKTICYYDNALEIGKIPYAQLIMDCAKEADIFLVPSKCAAQSSNFEGCRVVGNPDFDIFDENLSLYTERKNRVTYFGGYDNDYERAFINFVKEFKDWHGEVVVRPHPRSDGTLERKWVEGTNIIVGEKISTIESVGISEVVVIHRSSVGTKASIAGKKVIAIDEHGEVKEIFQSRDILGIPKYSVDKILSNLL